MLFRILMLSLLIGLGLQANDLTAPNQENNKTGRFIEGVIWSHGKLSPERSAELSLKVSIEREYLRRPGYLENIRSSLPSLGILLDDFLTYIDRVEKDPFSLVAYGAYDLFCKNKIIEDILEDAHREHKKNL